MIRCTNCSSSYHEIEDCKVDTRADAARRTTEPDDDTQHVKRLVSVDDAPVSDGPARHHANADPSHSAVPTPRVTHKF